MVKKTDSNLYTKGNGGHFLGEKKLTAFQISTNLLHTLKGNL